MLVVNCSIKRWYQQNRKDVIINKVLLFEWKQSFIFIFCFSFQNRKVKSLLPKWEIFPFNFGNFLNKEERKVQYWTNWVLVKVCLCKLLFWVLLCETYVSILSRILMDFNMLEKLIVYERWVDCRRAFIKLEKVH